MKVLITGGTGFTGRHLIATCLQAGDVVYATYRRHPLDIPDVHWVAVDLLEAEQTAEVVRTIRPEGIIHLAGWVGIQPQGDVGVLYAGNLLGTIHLLNSLVQYAPHCRTLIVGSAAQYGSAVQAGELVSESLYQQPTTHYGLSKKSQAEVASLFAQRDQLPLLMTRTFNLAGRGDRDSSLLSTAARQLWLVKKGQQTTVQLGSLHATRDIVDIRDAVTAYRLLLEKGQVAETYNVCSGQGRQIRQVVYQLADLIGVPREKIVEHTQTHAVAGNVDWMVGNAGKIRTEIDWQPQISWSETLKVIASDWEQR